MRWTIHLDGGPRRVNHAAVVIDGRVYSFGGYSSEEKYARNELIDVHILDTETYRWKKVQPAFSRKRPSADMLDSRRSSTNNNHNGNSIPKILVNDDSGSRNSINNSDRSSVVRSRAVTDGAVANAHHPTTSASFSHVAPSGHHGNTGANSARPFRQVPQSRRSIPFAFTLATPMVQDNMGRRCSVAELHPLGQLRSYRPPIDGSNDDDDIGNGAKTPRRNTLAVDDATADFSQDSEDSGFAGDVDPVSDEHEFSLIHMFRRQRAATVDCTASMGQSSEDGLAIRDPRLLAGKLFTPSTSNDREQSESTSHQEEVVNQMARDFDDLGAMDVDNNYYYDDAPAPANDVIPAHRSDDRIDEEEEEDEEDDDTDSYMSDVIEDDFEDFEDEEEDSEEEEDGNEEIEAQPEQNFIDGNEEDEVYDDFDFNYHNLANVGVAARLQRMQAEHRRRLSQQNEAVAPSAAAQHRMLEMLRLPAPQRRRANSVFARVGAGSRRKSRQYVAPFHRYGHTVVAYKGKAYLWGGRSDAHNASTVLHEFDPVTCRWSVVRFAQGSFEPPARDGHSAVVYGDSMYVFGGFEESYHRFSQETYAFHFPTATWKLLRTEGNMPLHRDFHTACVLGDGKMYMFGGRSDEGGQFTSERDIYCSRLWCLDLKKLRWSEVATTGEAPTGRRSHSVWTYNGKMYLFGGYSGEKGTHYNDLHVFDPERAHWSVVRPSCGVDAPPSPRRRQCTVAVGDKVFLFGGTMPTAKKRLMDLADLYVLDYAPSLSTLSAGAMIRYGLGDSYNDILPETVQKEIEYMRRPNAISRSDRCQQE